MTWAHVSASQIDTFLSCNRKWWLDKIGKDGIRTSTASQELGTAVHANIEAFLRGAAPLDHPLLSLNTFAAAVKARSNVELLIEHEFHVPGDKESMGFIDLVVVDRAAGTVEIWDHKTTKDWKYAKTQEELRTNPQGKVYVLAMHALFGDGFRYFFGHHVIRTSKVEPERLEQVEFFPVMIESARASLGMTIRSMISASTVDDGRDVPPNESQCWKYGGCQYRTLCKGNDPMPSLDSFTAQAPPAGPKYPSVIYIDCIPLNVEVTRFTDWTAGLEATFKKEVGQDSIKLKYAEGVIAIATKARDLLDAPVALFIRASDAAGMKYLSLVEAQPGVVVVQSIR